MTVRIGWFFSLCLTLAASEAVSQEAPPIEASPSPVVSESAPDAAPIAPEIQEVKERIVAVAHLQDTGFPALRSERLARLDDVLWSELAGREQSRFKLVRLERRSAPCPRECALEEARRMGAEHLIWAAVRDPDKKPVVVAFVTSTKDGQIILTRSSDIRDLDVGISAIALDVADAVFNNRDDKRRESIAADLAAAAREQRRRNLASPQYDAKKRRRDAGISVFALGVVLEGIGAGLLVVGARLEDPPFLWRGSVIGGVGVLLSGTGLGVWVSNQIQMSRIERGVPVSRRWKMQGLSPLVASREGIAPGMSVSLSF